MAKVFAPQIATGNDLLEGDVVYFTAAGGWTRVLAEAATAGSREEADALLAQASKFPNEVVGVYLTDVALDAAFDLIAELGDPLADESLVEIGILVHRDPSQAWVAAARASLGRLLGPFSRNSSRK